jgi:hypothetical protein
VCVCVCIDVYTALVGKSQESLNGSAGILKDPDYVVVHHQKSRFPSSHILHCLPQNDAVPNRQSPWLCSTLIQSVTDVCGLELEHILNIILCISF